MARPQLRLKRYAVWLYISSMAGFVFLKLVARPWIREHTVPRLLQVVVLSLPNFIEAVLGMGIVSAILTVGKHQLSPRFDNLSKTSLLSAALLLAGTYVLTQEFQLHSLGGNNVYDPYDVVASVIGLVITFVTLLKFGLIERQS